MPIAAAEAPNLPEIEPAPQGKTPGGARHADEYRRGPRRSFKILHKLALIAALGNLPVVVVGAMFVDQARNGMSFAEKERTGIAYLGAVWPAFSATATFGRPAAPLLQQLLDSSRTFDPKLNTETTTSRFLRRATEGGAPAIQAGQDLFRRIADNANLSVDPDLSTLQAIGILVSGLPEVGGV